MQTQRESALRILPPDLRETAARDVVVDFLVQKRLPLTKSQYLSFATIMDADLDEDQEAILAALPE